VSNSTFGAYWIVRMRGRRRLLHNWGDVFNQPALEEMDTVGQCCICNSAHAPPPPHCKEMLAFHLLWMPIVPSHWK
jgi:hypothetical protein